MAYNKNNNYNPYNQNISFGGYNQSKDTTTFGGDISKVNNNEFSAQNSDARAFGVDIFAPKKPKQQPRQQYDDYKRQQPSIKKQPFGQPPANKQPFGKPPNRTDVVNASNYNNPAFGKPEIAHKWMLSRKFDPKQGEIIITIEDSVTNKNWKKVITKQEHYGDMKQEYFRIGSIIDNGQAKYKYPDKDYGALEVSISCGNRRYDFTAPPLR